MAMNVQPYVKDGLEFDVIAVEGVRVTGFHGVLATERESGQVFLADIAAHVNTRAAGAADDLSRTVNYSDIADRAAEVLAGDPADLLETVASNIAMAVLEMQGVYCVDVMVHKPQAPLHVEFKDVSVRIRRDLRTGGLWADKRIGSAAGLADDPLSPGAIPPPKDLFDERPAKPATALLAFGGNVGDVLATLAQALDEVGRIDGVEVRSASSVVRTRPVGGPDQPEFLNGVVRITTTLAPRELLHACQGLEMVHGRERSVVNGPRTLDIDLIHYGTLEYTSNDLTLPHPRAHGRAFVLAPWLAMEPDAVLPGTAGGRVADLLGTAGDADGIKQESATWPKPSKPHVPRV